MQNNMSKLVYSVMMQAVKIKKISNTYETKKQKKLIFRGSLLQAHKIDLQARREAMLALQQAEANSPARTLSFTSVHIIN